MQRGCTPAPPQHTANAVASPALQLVIMQVPVEQVAVARDGAQVVLQLPQLERVLSGVSQPLVALLSQSAQPAQ